ncbi:hypothetical protein ACTA71_005568 [Dictyostelium dimigraforme]
MTQFRIILSLDGGGTKGLYTIEVIENLVKAIGSDFTKYVDLFGGTSTGGILSIAKSQEISNSELLKIYEGDESKRIFGGVKEEIIGILKRGEMFNSEELVNIAESWFAQSPDKASEQNKYKFFVVSLTKTGDDKEILTPVIISNYQLDPPVNEETDIIDGDKIKRLYTIGENSFSLAQAIRATSSIPGAFQTHKQDDVEYLDGGFKFNNPIAIAHHEARILYPDDYLVIISIGCTSEDVEGLTESNKEVNERLDKAVKVEPKGVFTFLKNNIITDLWETYKLNKKAKSSQQLFVEAKSSIKDDRAFLLRFDSVATHSSLSFSDTSKEFFEKLRACSNALREDPQFIETARLLGEIIELKLNPENN